MNVCPKCNGSGFVRDEGEFGRAMMGRRKQARLTLREVAGQMKLSVGYISDLEHGRKTWSPAVTASYSHALMVLEAARAGTASVSP